MLLTRQELQAMKEELGQCQEQAAVPGGWGMKGKAWEDGSCSSLSASPTNWMFQVEKRKHTELK